ncbi:hypothetical protein H1S01_17280 [Heliobacterium chlorum]|uniref:YolD-like family protein n=1 Tax=Heliobacterium chlorum TaxID=2698 RepID=A0ABR7T854_HELCL|nr:hypothetical protein [Heliobacterium chlorum]MBC9786218.1 hypothetical protein [Heliobacterium chlorum]
MFLKPKDVQVLDDQREITEYQLEEMNEIVSSAMQEKSQLMIQLRNGKQILCVPLKGRMGKLSVSTDRGEREILFTDIVDVQKIS